MARVYDYWLGGTDNFAADRQAGDQGIQAYPDIVFSVRANRAFLARAVRYLTGEAGIHQFLDRDPVVLAHACALLASRGRASPAALWCGVARKP